MRLVLGLGISVLVPATLLACLNDVDVDQQRSLPDLRLIITGRFDRNPPLYYEVRLRRVAEAIAADPRDLAAYDDAAVACDRLGRFDEAIAWMDQKRERLERADPEAPATKEHWYRYHANVGTHRAHRWLRGGADRSRLGEMKTARDHIARALAIKPDAHFGREAYQLRVMAWIVDPPAFGPGAASLPTLLDGKPYDPAEAIRGLAGLIVLGNAWESVDVFNALAQALDSYGNQQLGHLARLRCLELIAAGHHSLLPDAPRGSTLRSLIERENFRHLGVADVGRTAQSFREARAAAESHHSSRDAFMLARLLEGRHPDTDQLFWSGAGQGFKPGAFNEENSFALNLPPPPVPIVRPRRTLDPQDVLAQAMASILGAIFLTWAVARTLRAKARNRDVRKPLPMDPDWA